MKQLMMVITVTIGVSLIWIGVQAKVNLEKTYIPKNLLEISLPINGRIDTEFLKKLESNLKATILP
jgi:hypothetical protein